MEINSDFGVPRGTSNLKKKASEQKNDKEKFSFCLIFRVISWSA
jgi:hypothetical protein